MDGWTIRARRRTPTASRARTATTGSAAAASGSRRARSSRPRDTVYMGFGFEGITGADKRNDVMERAVNYLRR